MLLETMMTITHYVHTTIRLPKGYGNNDDNDNDDDDNDDDNDNSEQMNDDLKTLATACAAWLYDKSRPCDDDEE